MEAPSERSGSALDPAVLDRLEGLALVARTVVEGFMSGHHRSPQRGSSVEFAQHRQYVPGDELRGIDWKIFARSDRLVVKEFVAETNFSCHVLVDASESMAFGSLGWTKFDYARWCAASLTHLVIRQRDAAGLVLFDESVRDKVPPRTGLQQESEMVNALEQAVPKGATGVGSVLQWVAGRLRRRGIVAVFSDFFDDEERLVEGMRRLLYGGHEPILFQVLDPQELEFDYTGLLRLEGLEGSGRLLVDPNAIREAYKQELGKHVERLARAARELSCDFVPLSTATPLDVALSTYLARRAARARAGG
ncbi:MAG: DUF58 domain-containing protein [Planctomycetes bacterium]|nr:DUF58 domain-containing protein [Planctomycetota bacterium]